MSLPINTLFYSGDLAGASGEDNNLNTLYSPPINPITNVQVYAPVVINSDSWTVEGLFSYNIVFNLPTVTQAVWQIRTGVSANDGGILLESGIANTTPVLSGRTFEGLTEYLFEIATPPIVLFPGTYWFSVTPITASEEFYNSFTTGANSVGNQSSNLYFQNGVLAGYNRNYEPLVNPDPYATSNGVIGRINRVVCLHPETLVATMSEKSGISEMPIKDINRGMRVINHKNKPIEVLHNIFFPTKVSKFVKVPKDCLGTNVPSEDLYIRKEHPIMYKGRVDTAMRIAKKFKIVGIEEIEMNEASTPYTLCTKEKSFIKMNGVLVAAWSENRWLEHAKSNKLSWTSK